MNAFNLVSNKAPGSHLPLPDRQFKRFVTVFHVVFVGGLICSLVFRWRRTGLSWTALDTCLLLLVAAQIALYLGFFIVSPDRISPRGWGCYFGVAFALWFIEWRLEPDFEWAIGALLGQMFGVLRPRASLPTGAVVFGTYFAFKFGWSRLAGFTLWEWLIGSAMVVAWTALGLFIHKLVVTSAERARLIEDLEAARQQLELARQRDAELAALRERERLARDLHDSLGHNLVTLSVQLEAIQRLYSVDPARAESLLEEMKRLTRSSMEQLRRSLAGLRTPGLGDRPLKTAIEQICQELADRSGLTVDCGISEKAGILPPAISEVLWRAAHEGLANAEKHSHARAIQVSLELNGGGNGSKGLKAGSTPIQVTLQVADDGVGMPAGPESIPGHYGLRGLRERVEGLGGTFNISKGNPKGARLEVRIPVVSL